MFIKFIHHNKPKKNTNEECHTLAQLKEIIDKLYGEGTSASIDIFYLKPHPLSKSSSTIKTTIEVPVKTDEDFEISKKESEASQKDKMITKISFKLRHKKKAAEKIFSKIRGMKPFLKMGKNRPSVVKANNKKKAENEAKKTTGGLTTHMGFGHEMRNHLKRLRDRKSIQKAQKLEIQAKSKLLESANLPALVIGYMPQEDIVERQASKIARLISEKSSEILNSTKIQERKDSLQQTELRKALSLFVNKKIDSQMRKRRNSVRIRNLLQNKNKKSIVGQLILDKMKIAQPSNKTKDNKNKEKDSESQQTSPIDQNNPLAALLTREGILKRPKETNANKDTNLGENTQNNNNYTDRVYKAPLRGKQTSSSSSNSKSKLDSRTSFGESSEKDFVVGGVFHKLGDRFYDELMDIRSKVQKDTAEIMENRSNPQKRRKKDKSLQMLKKQKTVIFSDDDNPGFPNRQRSQKFDLEHNEKNQSTKITKTQDLLGLDASEVTNFRLMLERVFEEEMDLKKDDGTKKELLKKLAPLLVNYLKKMKKKAISEKEVNSASVNARVNRKVSIEMPGSLNRSGDGEEELLTDFGEGSTSSTSSSQEVSKESNRHNSRDYKPKRTSESIRNVEKLPEKASEQYSEKFEILGKKLDNLVETLDEAEKNQEREQEGKKHQSLGHEAQKIHHLEKRDSMGYRGSVASKQYNLVISRNETEQISSPLPSKQSSRRMRKGYSSKTSMRRKNELDVSGHHTRRRKNRAASEMQPLSPKKSRKSRKSSSKSKRKYSRKHSEMARIETFMDAEVPKSIPSGLKDSNKQVSSREKQFEEKPQNESNGASLGEATNLGFVKDERRDPNIEESGSVQPIKYQNSNNWMRRIETLDQANSKEVGQSRAQKPKKLIFGQQGSGFCSEFDLSSEKIIDEISRNSKCREPSAKPQRPHLLSEVVDVAQDSSKQAKNAQTGINQFFSVSDMKDVFKDLFKSELQSILKEIIATNVEGVSEVVAAKNVKNDKVEKIEEKEVIEVNKPAKLKLSDINGSREDVVVHLAGSESQKLKNEKSGQKSPEKPKIVIGGDRNDPISPISLSHSYSDSISVSKMPENPENQISKSEKEQPRSATLRKDMRINVLSSHQNGKQAHEYPQKLAPRNHSRGSRFLGDELKSVISQRSENPIIIERMPFPSIEASSHQKSQKLSQKSERKNSEKIENFEPENKLESDTSDIFKESNTLRALGADVKQEIKILVEKLVDKKLKKSLRKINLEAPAELKTLEYSHGKELTYKVSEPTKENTTENHHSQTKEGSFKEPFESLKMHKNTHGSHNQPQEVSPACRKPYKTEQKVAENVVVVADLQPNSRSKTRVKRLYSDKRRIKNIIRYVDRFTPSRSPLKSQNITPVKGKRFKRSNRGSSTRRGRRGDGVDYDGHSLSYYPSKQRELEDIRRESPKGKLFYRWGNTTEETLSSYDQREEDVIYSAGTDRKLKNRLSLGLESQVTQNQEFEDFDENESIFEDSEVNRSFEAAFQHPVFKVFKKSLKSPSKKRKTESDVTRRNKASKWTRLPLKESINSQMVSKPARGSKKAERDGRRVRIFKEYKSIFPSLTKQIFDGFLAGFDKKENFSAISDPEIYEHFLDFYVSAIHHKNRG